MDLNNNFLWSRNQMRNLLVFSKNSFSSDLFLKNIALTYVTMTIEEPPMKRILFLLNRCPEKSSGYREEIKKVGLKNIVTGPLAKLGFCLIENAATLGIIPCFGIDQNIFQTVLKNISPPLIETCTFTTQFLKEELKISALRTIAMAIFSSTYNKKGSPQRFIIAAGFVGLIPFVVQELASLRFLTPSQFILLEK